MLLLGMCPATSMAVPSEGQALEIWMYVKVSWLCRLAHVLIVQMQAGSTPLVAPGMACTWRGSMELAHSLAVISSPATHSNLH